MTLKKLGAKLSFKVYTPPRATFPYLKLVEAVESYLFK